MSQLMEVFKNRSKIWEGLRNKVFKDEHVEAVFSIRYSICKECNLFDNEGSGCVMPGTQPCCNKNLLIKDELSGEEVKGCGCSLSLKLRSLSSECPARKWPALTNQQEEDMIRQQIVNSNLNGTSN